MPPKKRGAPAASTSAKTDSSSAPSSASTKETCCVCCQTIHIGKDDALFCSGTCQHWLHRYCASVSVQCYKCIKDDDRPFYCFWCYQSRSQREIAALTTCHTQHTHRAEVWFEKREIHKQTWMHRGQGSGIVSITV